LRVARIGCASVSVVADNVSWELASSSVLVNVASGCYTFVLVFANVGAEALLVASAESLASSSTKVSGNVVTGLDGETV